MSDLKELYQQVIIDHSRQPRNAGKLDAATHQQEGFNPLCGDKVTVYLNVQQDRISDVKFEACGCAISVASASLMSETLKGKSTAEIKSMFEGFQDVVTGKQSTDAVALGKLAVLAGVAEFPMRVKCATLAWHTVLSAFGKK